MPGAIVVREITEIVSQGERVPALWIVVTDDPEAAQKAVEARVSAGSIVQATDGKVGAETVKRLGLAPGQAWQL